MPTLLWTKGKWRIERRWPDLTIEHPGYSSLTISDGLLTYSMIVYDDLTVGFDHPLALPRYVRDKARAIGRRLAREQREALAA